MKNIKPFGHKLITLIEDIGLFVIAVATVVAMGYEIVSMIHLRTVTLADLLILFIYLEVLAMVSIYLDSGKLPVRMPLYIAIVALARYMILDMKNMNTVQMLGVASAALLLAITILVIRYGHAKFPYDEKHGGN